MGNEFAQAHDALGASVVAPTVDLGRGTTRWTVQRWDEEQTEWADQALRDLGCRALHSAPGGGIAASGFSAVLLNPYEVSEVVGNLITNAGWTRLMNLLTNQGATQALTATAVRIGVGDSNTAETYTDTALGAATNKLYQPVSGAGSLGTRTLAFSATFGTADANWAWNEFGLDVGTPTVTASATVAALFFNHKAGIAQGTKASGQTWTATATLSFT